jgi:hypothetical protein
MSYGTIKVDTITFTDNSVDKSVSLSGLIQNPTFTGNITVTGTISGDVIRGGTTVSGATVTGTTANFVSGVFTTQISGATVTGTTASFTSGVFTNISGTTATITSGIIASGTAAAPSLAILADLDTGLFSPGANQLAVATNGTGRLFVDASGKVGVGTASPAFSNGDGLEIQRDGTACLRLDDNTNSKAGEIFADSTGLNIDARGTSAVLNFDIGGSTKATLDNSGRLLVGTSSSRTVGDRTHLIQIEGNSSGDGGVSMVRNFNDDNATSFTLAKTRGASVGATTIVQNGDTIGEFAFAAADGSDVITRAALIHGAVDGTPGANDMPGRLVFSTTADGSSSPSERLRITSAGLVGIGTSAPTELLHLSGASATALVAASSGVGSIQLTRGTTAFQAYASTSACYIGTTSATDFQLRANNSEAARITSAGLVGIGTSSPNVPLDIESSSGTAVKIRLASNTSNRALVFSNAAETIGWTVGNGVIASARQFVVYDNEAGAARLLIDSSGRVGIGTASPQGNLEVSNTASGATIRLTRPSSADFEFYASSDTFILTDKRSSTERLRIDSSGRLLIGTSSGRAVGFTSLQAPVQVETTTAAAYTAVNNTNDANGCYVSIAKTRGTSAGAVTAVQNNDELGAIRISGSDGTGFVVGAQIIAAVDGTPGTNDLPTRLTFSVTADGASSPTEQMRISANGTIRTGAGVIADNTNGAGTTDTGGGFIAIRNNTFSAVATCFEIKTGTPKTNRLVIRNDGDVENVNNSYGALSDVKLKENIVEANSQWSDIKALQVRKYNFKTATGYGTHTQIGLVAQEAELVSPGLVTESPDRDEDGNDLGTVTKSVNYSVLYMKAVKALQEAMERIEALEADVAQLKGA